MVGRNIDGYILCEFKGSGSFGTVYRCQKDGVDYAIKIFSIAYVMQQFKDGIDNRITREITALKAVQSKYAAKYITDGRFIDNGIIYVYVVMDYVQGTDLAERLRSISISVAEATEMFEKIVIALSSIHACHIIHRDLKPANIYIQADGNVKILDFGLSKLIDFTSITSTGDEIGSPLYMSPEQIADSKNLDYRSDYYALGVIFYEMLSKQNPYGKITSKPELYYKICHEPPMSIRAYIPTINNAIDNLLLSLLEKENYKRPNNASDIIRELHRGLSPHTSVTRFLPSFYLRTWNEKSILEQFYADGNSVENYIFPINHQHQQRNLLGLIMKSGSNYMIDPATMRLAYDSFSGIKGLAALPYAPMGYNRLELDNLRTIEDKRKYVKKVIDEQLQHNPSYIIAPFHVSNNSNLVRIKATDDENWFSTDVKLLSEARDYLDFINCPLKLVGGFCVKTDILTTKSEREYFLNVLSGLPCDTYWIYVDCINNESNAAQLYHYANALLSLQKSTGKPVIAGRVGTFGLAMLAFGLYAFESGAARFESFYEELFKDVSDSFNMYVQYYFPELMRNVSIERKNPARIIQILASATGQSIACHCPYCEGKRPEELVIEQSTKKHFLFRRNEEIEHMRSLQNNTERVDYIERCIQDALRYHKELTPIFKVDDYRHFNIWLEVINRLKEEWI